MTALVGCLTAMGYALAGMAVSADLAARIKLWTRAERFGRDDVALVAAAGLFWPLTLLAMAWFAGFQWRERQLQEKGKGI